MEENDAEINKKVGYIQKTIDFQGIDYERWSAMNVNELRIDEQTLLNLLGANNSSMTTSDTNTSVYKARINYPVSL